MRTEDPADALRGAAAAMPEQRDPSGLGVGALLARERVRAGLTQVQLAKRAGMTQGALSRIETGGSSPSIRSVQRLADALGLQCTLVLRRGDQMVGELAGGALS